MTTPTLDQLDTSLARAACLPSSQDEVALITALYRQLATGTAPTSEALARDADVDTQFVEERLERWPGVFRADERGVVGFWGLALTDMPHRVRFGDGPEVRAWCAWDPMFIAPIVRPATVDTDDPVSDELISYRVGPDGLDGIGEGQVVSFLEPGTDWDADVVTSFCHYVLHFTGRDTGQAWVDEHPGTFLLSVDAAAELGRRHAQRLTTPSDVGDRPSQMTCGCC